MDKAEILNIYSKNYTLPKSNIISRFESHETLESEFHENKVVDKKEKLLVDLTSKKTSLQSQKNMLIKLSNKMGMSPKNKMVKAHHAKTVSMSLFDSDYKIDNSYANKDISETLFTLKNLISYSEISIKKKRTTVSPAIDYTFRKNVEKDSPPKKELRKISSEPRTITLDLNKLKKLNYSKNVDLLSPSKITNISQKSPQPNFSKSQVFFGQNNKAVLLNQNDLNSNNNKIFFNNSNVKTNIRTAKNLLITIDNKKKERNGLKNEKGSIISFEKMFTPKIKEKKE